MERTLELIFFLISLPRVYIYISSHLQKNSNNDNDNNNNNNYPSRATYILFVLFCNGPPPMCKARKQDKTKINNKNEGKKKKRKGKKKF